MLTGIPGGNPFHEDMKIYQIQLKLQKSGNSPVLRERELISHSFTRVFLSFNGNSRWLGMGFLFSINSMLSTTGWENPKAGCDLCKGNLPSKNGSLTFRLRTRIERFSIDK